MNPNDYTQEELDYIQSVLDEHGSKYTLADVSRGMYGESLIVLLKPVEGNEKYVIHPNFF